MAFLRQRNDLTQAPADDEVKARAEGPGPVSPNYQAHPAGQSTATDHARLTEDVGSKEQVSVKLPKNAGPSGNSEGGGGDDLPEYKALQRFITNYDAERRASSASQAEPSRTSKRWWQFWKSSPAPVQRAHPVIKEGQPPSSWLETDIRKGIAGHDIEARRKPFGSNELTAEKENMFAKFLGFFQGPILYGRH